MFLEVAVMGEWSTVVVDHIAEKLFHGDFSQRRVFVQVADNLSAQYPEVVHVPANGLPGKTG